jgi:hypothetical protein
MHHSAVADRGEHGGERDFASEHRCPQLALGHSDRLPRTERDAFKGAAIFAQSDFAVGGAVEIVEDHSWYAALGYAPKVGNIDYP